MNRDAAVPMSSPDITDAERRAVAEVLAGTRLSLGPWAQRFEDGLCALTGAEFAVAVSSGTAGLHLCLVAAGVGEGDLVVTTPFSFVASANVVTYTGATPVFVDVDLHTGNISAPAVAAALAGDPGSLLPPRGAPHAARVAAVLPVHVFGQPAEMDVIAQAAGRARAAVVEDACEAIGSSYHSRPAGTLGRAGVFAFYPNKQMTTGEGGAVVTSDEGWASLVRALSNQGRDEGDLWLEHSRIGFNYRMDEMSAALGAVQLGRLDELIEGRQRVATLYEERLAGIPDVTLPHVAESTTRMSWFCYVIRLPAKARPAVIDSLAADGVPAKPYFPPIHLQRPYRERFGYEPGMFPAAEELGATSLALPFSSVTTEAQVDRVGAALRRAMS